MGYYDKLVAKWPSVAGADTAAKLAALNSETVAVTRDVTVRDVAGVLGVAGALGLLVNFAAGTPTAQATHDAALFSAKSLAALFQMQSPPSFQMSDEATYQAVAFMLGELLAQEQAQANSTGVTQGVHDTLLALAASAVPWWQANDYKRAINVGDVVVAALDTTGYSVTLGAPQPNGQNVTISVVVTGPHGAETINTLANTLDADYAKFFAANCVQNIITRDASLATFG